MLGAAASCRVLPHRIRAVAHGARVFGTASKANGQEIPYLVDVIHEELHLSL